jgi:hypothetical protein
MMNGLQNIFRREGARAAAQQSFARMATVTSYDPEHYAAKVKIQPENYETGFLPIATPWVGNGWGLFAPPSPGDVVDVHFQEGGKLAAYLSLRFFGNSLIPVSVPSGEFRLIHQSGSTLAFRNDGSVELTAAADLNINVTGNVNGFATQWNLIGDLIVSGDIYDRGGVSGSIHTVRTVYNGHTHSDPQGGVTGAPNQPM